LRTPWNIFTTVFHVSFSKELCSQVRMYIISIAQFLRIF
jgi:hypothetical protein